MQVMNEYTEVITAEVAHNLDQAMQAVSLTSPGKNLIVALDIDGTISCHDFTFSPNVFAAMVKLRQQGTRTVICTGRGYGGIVELIKVMDGECEKIGLSPQDNPFRTGYVILQNGAQILRLSDKFPSGYEEIAHHLFDATQAVAKLKDVVPGAAFMAEQRHGPLIVSGDFPAEEIWGDYQKVSLQDLVKQPVSRLTFRAPNLSAEEFEDKITSLGLRGVNYAIGWSAWLDIGPTGISKASAIAELCKYLHINPVTSTVAVGDGANDVEMLQWATLGVAMGQAEDFVKAAAKVVTLPVEKGGVALLIDRLLAYGNNRNISV